MESGLLLMIIFIDNNNKTTGGKACRSQRTVLGKASDKLLRPEFENMTEASLLAFLTVLPAL